jgi:hypothetical protein
MLSSPNLNRDLTIFVKDKLSDYLAHAGILYHEFDSVAYIEPVLLYQKQEEKILLRLAYIMG